MDLFRIDPGLAVWTWIVFGALVFLLSKFAFPSLLASLREREGKIERAVDNAALLERKLSEMEAEYAERIRQANAEADVIIRRIRAEGEETRKRLAEKAENEARAIIEEARVKSEEERAAAMQSMRREVARLVLDTSEKVIGKTLTSREDIDWSKTIAESL